MANLNQVQNIIQHADPLADVAGVEERGGRIFGVVVSPSFAPMTAEQRSAWMREVVRNELGSRGVNVGILIAVAPGENPW